MKLFCRITALALALLLLCLSASAAEGSVDFAALAARGNVETHVGVTVTCPPRLEPMEWCEGTEDYAFIRAWDRRYYISDYSGNILFSLDPEVDSAELKEGNFVTACFRNGDLRVYDVTGKQLSVERYALQNDCRAAATGLGDEYVLIVNNAADRATGQQCSLLIDSAGRYLAAERFGRFWQGIVTCSENGKWGAREPFGKTWLPFEYDYLEFAADGVLLCRKNGMYGLIDLEGNTVVPFDYDEMELLHNDDYRRVAVRQGTRWGVIDLTGRVRVPVSYSYISGSDFRQLGGTPAQWYTTKQPPDTGWYYVCEDDAITYKGSPVMPKDATVLSENRFLVRIPDTYLYELVDAQGQRLLDARISRLEAFDGGYYMVVRPDTQQCLGRIYSEDLELKREFDHVVAENPNSTQTLQFKYFGRTDQVLLIQRESPYRVEICTYDGEVIDTRQNTLLRNVFNHRTIVLEYGKQLAVGTADGRHFTPYLYAKVNPVNGEEGELVSVELDRENYLLHNSGTRMLSVPVFDSFRMINAGPDSGHAVFRTAERCGFLCIAPPELCFADVNDADWFAGSTAFCVNAGLMRGVGGGRFAPQTAMTRAMLVQVLYNLSGEACEPFGFEDVAENAWYADAVNWAAANEIVNGVSTERFAPDAPVTREQMVTILRRYALRFGEAEGRSDALEGFADRGWVSDYARDALCWAVTAGLINGRTPTTLEPQGQAKRAEIATVLMRFVNLMAADKTRE